MAGPYDLYEVLEAEYEALHGKLPDATDGEKPRAEEGTREYAEARLAAVCDAVHKLPRPRTALCFSGGGIRSATFGLGVLQGLAGRGLLPEFDYLSTVSGGGYLGGWFSAWLKREADKLKGERAAGGGDEREQAREDGKQATENIQRALNFPPAPKLQPEPEPVRHLRSYSNYMSPKLGLLSADTWTLVAIYFRNLFLNWLVLIPLILGVLAIPRFSLAIASWRIPVRVEGAWLQLAFWAAVACGVFAISYIIASRPSVADDGASVLSKAKRYEGWFLILCMAPLLLLSRLIASYWAWLRIPVDRLKYNLFGYDLPHNAVAFALFGVMLYFGAYLVARIFLVKWKKSLRLEWLVAIITGALGGLLTYLMAAYVFDNPVGLPAGATAPDASGVVTAARYVCLAAPTFLLLFLAAATIFVGLASFYTTDADREWLARCGAWILIAALGWIAISSVVIFGPVLLFYFGPKILTAVGSAAGLVTVGGAASGKTAANEKEEKKKGKSGWTPLLKNLAIAFAAPVFAIFLLIVLSLLMTFLAQAIHDALAGASWVPAALKDALSLKTIEWDKLPRWSYAGEDGKPVLVDRHGLLNVLYYMPGWFFFALTLLIVAVGVLMGLYVNINKFSLHGAYRDRLIRAYLGASRIKSQRSPNPFTGFDERDNVGMSELASRPLHVVNMTLNLVSLSSEQLAWQDRKAESFTATRLFCGSFCIPHGYRKSERYGYDEGAKRGISLGTAVAISGAAASPNMGYYSSTFVTFLLSLFNVRLGWWLGNPGTAGKDTWDRSGPRFGPRALVAETLGWTDDRHPYVYLSDGGHFENLGLYEMVLRRCHLIVVSDGSADPSLSFNDLGNAISKIRDDLGIPIIFDDLPIAVKERDSVRCLQSTEKAEKYAAVGTICYSRKDKGAPDGVIIYLKPNVYGGEPADVFHYAKANPDFPHESTGDQMYDESQFESYRALGQHVIETICKGGKGDGLEAFKNQVCEYLGRPGNAVLLPKCPPLPSAEG